MRFVARWVAGPDAGGVVPLRPGRQVVGRSHRAEVRCDDPAVRARHAVLAVIGSDVVIAPLAAGGAVVVDGAPLVEPTRVALGAWIEIGHSVLAVEREPVEHAPRRPREAALLPGAASAALSGIAAAQLAQPTIAVAGGVGFALPTISWTAQLAVERQRRRSLTLGFLAETAETSARPTAVTTALRPGSVIAITGPLALPVARSLVLQALAAHTVDLLCVVSNSEHDWDWCGALAPADGPRDERIAVARRMAVLEVRATTDQISDGCTALFATGDSPIAWWLPDLGERPRAARRECRVRIVGVGETAAFRRAAALAASQQRGRGGRRTTTIVVR